MPLFSKKTKVRATDYRPENLPQNRVQLFFDALSARFWKLITANLMFVAFTLPLWGWTYYNITVMAQDLNNALSYVFPWLVGMIPAMTLAGPPLMGLSYLLRNWARGDHAFVWMDFKDAMKENWKQGMILMFINSLVVLAFFVANNFYTLQIYETEGNIMYYLLQYLLWMMALMYLMMNLIVFPMLVTYEMKFTTAIRNALVMVVARLPLSILMTALSLGLLVLVYWLHPIAGVLFILVLGLALSGLISASYANSCMDMFINPHIEGAAVNQGMYITDEDEDDEEEE